MKKNCVFKKVVGLLFVLGLCFVMSLSPAVYAATFTVNSTADALDANPGDGLCDDGSGNCTLRAAIIEANALADADLILLSAGTYILSIEGRDEDACLTGDLDIIDDLTINGADEANTVIDANGIDRVVHIIGANAELLDMTVAGGNLPSGFGEGAGILNRGSATFTNCTITDSRSADGTGGLASDGPATLSNCTISNNVGGDGAGGVVTHDTASLSDCTISGNVSSGFGDAGGILIFGTATLTNCAIINNYGGEGFGGLENASTATLTNSTISGNAGQLRGGGVLNDGTATLINCTVTDNDASDGGGVWNSGTVELRSSIVSNNTSGGDCSGGITSLGHNLDSDGSCNLTQPNDLPNTDPLLGPLTNNGGLTMTHALHPGSAAIDAGEAVCLDTEGNPLETDQRGVSRPLDGDSDGKAICDIGAYEAGPWLAASVLPGARSVSVGNPAAAFATIINTAPVTATECSISSRTNVPAQFLYQTTDPITNEPTGTPNTAVDIASGAGQTFLVAFTPNAELAEEVVRFQFDCTNTGPAPEIDGVNTLLLSASTSPVPDIFASHATTNNDGIVTIPGETGTGVLVVAIVNVGAAGSITVSADTGSVTLPGNVFVCETNPNTSVCLTGPGPEVTTTIESNATPTFGVFVVGEGTVPFDPANNRVFVSSRDDNGIVRGSTSVAVRTQ